MMSGLYFGGGYPGLYYPPPPLPGLPPVVIDPIDFMVTLPMYVMTGGQLNPTRFVTAVELPMRIMARVLMER